MIYTTGSFDIVGIPHQQGSKQRFGKVMVEAGTAESRAKHKAWRGVVAERAREVCDELGVQFDGPLQLEVVFRFPMPASRSKADRLLGTIPKVSAPDLDKLIRALGDGLTAGGLIRDDARVATIIAMKLEVTAWTGATVCISKIPTKGNP